MESERSDIYVFGIINKIAEFKERNNRKVRDISISTSI